MSPTTLVHYLEASYHVDGERQAVKPGHGERVHAQGGILPTPFFERRQTAYPMLRYPWSQTRAALESLAATEPGLTAVQVSYVNPQTGRDAQNILGYYALMLRPGQTLKLPARSPATVCHLIEGDAEAQVQEHRFALSAADTCCLPGYTPWVLVNSSADAPAFFFIADEAPLHRKLGIYEQRF